MSNRILYFDIIKLFGMFCVVWAHVMQNLTVNSNYWLYDSACRIVFSFHMPLFMMVSGYFAYSSLFKPSLLSVVRRKFVQLIIPSVLWGLIVTGLAMVVHRDFSADKFRFLAENTLFSYWFLKALFFCYLLTLLGAAFFRYSRTMFVLYIILMLALSNYLDYSNAMSMMPFFMFGLFLHYHSDRIINNAKIVLVISLATYLLMFSTWAFSDYNMYSHPFSFSNLRQFTIRTIIGLSGSLCWIIIIKKVIDSFNCSLFNKLSKMGQMTMGIYLIQLIFAESLCKIMSVHVSTMFSKLPPPIWVWYDFIITPMLTIVIMLIIVWIIKLIRKNNIASLLLLGE